MQCAAKGLYNSRRGAVADDGVPVSLDVDETVDPGPIAKLSAVDGKRPVVIQLVRVKYQVVLSKRFRTTYSNMRKNAQRNIEGMHISRSVD